MSIFSRMRSVLGTVLKTVLIDPNVNTAKTQITEPIERFSDPILNKTYKDMNEADVKQIVRNHKIAELIAERDQNRDQMDASDWKDWREKYDAIQ